LEVKTSDDFFNGIEAVRFDYDNALAYVSAAFGHQSNSIYIQIKNQFNDLVPVSYQGISKYYDNRDAAVTSTADDWADYCDYKFVQSCREFRKRKLWLSTAIITQWCSPDTWNNIQTQLDSGYVEAAAHSRIHPRVPYSNYESEVSGCKNDIINNLVLPEQFKLLSKEYVYIWVAPYGDYDDFVDSLVSENKYLTSRMYYNYFDSHIFSEWDKEKKKYDPIGVSLEIGPTSINGQSWEGTDDINVLNSTFDSVAADGGIYHAMIHPNVDVNGKDYFEQHLDYISGRKNIWYAATGHLYLYHLLQENSQTPAAINDTPDLTAADAALLENYPNPFNPSTQITFNLDRQEHVILDVYNLLGQKIESLLNKPMPAGYHKVEFNGQNLPSGTYFYKLEAGEFQAVRKAVLIK